MVKIFLDDVRTSYDDTWTLVKSYDEFVHLIQTSSHITDISFDHDLGDDNVKSGMDCAKFLVDYCIDNPDFAVFLQELIVHSYNPVGKQNIVSLFKSAQKHGIIPSQVKITTY